MIPQRSPLIQIGQIYLNEELDEYLIVTRNNRGQIYYEGDGFSGQAEDWSFIERFPPVDPDDVDIEEIILLVGKCPCGTEAKVGYVELTEDDDIEYEEETEDACEEQVIMA